jgi:hypothetical protein
VIIGHDRDDAVVPVEESRRLRDDLSGNRGLRYTEFAMFEHADPTRRRLKPWKLARELCRSWGHLNPMFRTAAGIGIRAPADVRAP